METGSQREIESCPYLFLRELEELGYGRLRIVLEEGQVAVETETIKVGSIEIPDGRRVYSNEESRLFELVWDHYVSYAVTNESYACNDSEEIFEGRRYRIYSKSRFRDFLGFVSFANDEYPDHCNMFK